MRPRIQKAGFYCSFGVSLVCDCFDAGDEEVDAWSAFVPPVGVISIHALRKESDRAAGHFVHFLRRKPAAWL